MNFITPIVKILQYFGFDPPLVVREKFFYPLWKLISYLSENNVDILVISLVFICMGVLLFDVKRRRNKKTAILVFDVSISLIAFIAIGVSYLFARVWLFDPAEMLHLKPDTINIIVMPILNTDTQSYLHLDNIGTYEQDVLTKCLTKNMPRLPCGARVSVKSLPSIHIPSFLYKPDDFNIFFKSIRNYTFIVWGYKVDNKIEKIRLDANPDRITDLNDQEQISQSKMFQDKLSNTTSILFNDLNTLPLHKILNFLSLLITGVIEQSLNVSLVELGQYSYARHQLDLCLSRIDSAFENLLTDSPSTKHSDLNKYHDSYRELFLEFKKTIELEEQDAIDNIQESFDRVMANPYSPFHNPEQYFEWLSKQENIYSLGRYFPVITWKPNDSAFDIFIYNVFRSRNKVLHNEEIQNMFEKLRAKYGDIFIIDYYEAIILMATWGNANQLGRILDRQRTTNKYNMYLTDIQTALYKTYVVGIDKIK
jgi:hypothetical protein